MLDITEMKKLLKASLPHKRFKHSLAVYDTALELAVFYGLDKEKVGVGALLHDCGREIPTRDLLMHTMLWVYRLMMSKGISLFYSCQTGRILRPGKIRRYRSGNFGCYPFSYYWCGRHEQDGDGCLSG